MDYGPYHGGSEPGGGILKGLGIGVGDGYERDYFPLRGALGSYDDVDLAGGRLGAISDYTVPTWLKIISALSAGASAYHGYRRHSRGEHPVLWAIGWSLLGGLFPVVVPAIAMAQGFAEPLPAGRA